MQWQRARDRITALDSWIESGVDRGGPTAARHAGHVKRIVVFKRLKMVEANSYRSQKQLYWMAGFHLQEFQLIVKGQLDPADVFKIDDGLVVRCFHRHAERENPDTLA